MFVWAPLPATHRSMGAVEFAAALLREARVAVSPGVGFGPGGEGFVRFSLGRDRRARPARLRGHLRIPAQAPIIPGVHRRLGG